MDSEKPYTSSQICLNFGDKVQSDPPFSVHMDLNLMSSKVQAISLSNKTSSSIFLSSLVLKFPKMHLSLRLKQGMMARNSDQS